MLGLDNQVQPDGVTTLLGFSEWVFISLCRLVWSRSFPRACHSTRPLASVHIQGVGRPTGPGKGREMDVATKERLLEHLGTQGPLLPKGDC